MNTHGYHPVVDRIVTFLTSKHVWFETFEHAEVRTSQEASQMRNGYTLHEGTKALLVRIRINASDTGFRMLAIPGDAKFDEKAVKSLLGASSVSFASEEEISRITAGVLPGGIPPLGFLFGLETIADPSVLENERIIFNAGDRRYSVAMRSQDYRRIVNPLVSQIIRMPLAR